MCAATRPGSRARTERQWSALVREGETPSGAGPLRRHASAGTPTIREGWAVRERGGQLMKLPATSDAGLLGPGPAHRRRSPRPGPMARAGFPSRSERRGLVGTYGAAAARSCCLSAAALDRTFKAAAYQSACWPAACSNAMLCCHILSPRILIKRKRNLGDQRVISRR